MVGLLLPLLSLPPLPAVFFGVLDSLAADHAQEEEEHPQEDAEQHQLRVVHDDRSLSEISLTTI